MKIKIESNSKETLEEIISEHLCKVDDYKNKIIRRTEESNDDGGYKEVIYFDGEDMTERNISDLCETIESETSAFTSYVNNTYFLLVENGFELEHTGGGCLVLTKEFKGGGYLMVSDSDAGVDFMDHKIMVGIYDKEGDDLVLVDNEPILLQDSFLFKSKKLLSKGERQCLDCNKSFQVDADHGDAVWSHKCTRRNSAHMTWEEAGHPPSKNND